MNPLFLRQFAFFSLLLALGACSKKEKSNSSAGAAAVKQVQVKNLGAAPPSAAKLAEAEQKSPSGRFVTPSQRGMVSARFTFDKEKLFKTEYLFSLATQAHSKRKKEHQVKTAALLESRFQREGNRLLLVHSRKDYSESDANSSLWLLREFRIVREDEKTLDAEAEGASPHAVAVAVSKDDPTPRARYSWLRSAEISQDRNYVLLEGTYELESGAIASVMESFFPRSLLAVPGFKPELASKELNPMFMRFRALDNESGLNRTLADGSRRELGVVPRYARVDGKPIDFYVVNNLPAELLPAVKSGVEGWNRYSRKLWGGDLVRFAGMLPQGVKFGDPRYNVIQFHTDTRTSSAWESSASDPETGAISFSLINLPAYWVQSSKKEWQRGLGWSHIHSSAAAMREDFRPQDPPPGMNQDAYARHVLAITLFHEVGHSLGIDHNFKGSLAFDPANAKTMATTSIMDYQEDYFLTHVFRELGQPDGPLFEYDRQMISWLYNNGKDIADSDPVLPTCSNGDEDTVAGLDPECMQSDEGAHPENGPMAAYELFRREDAIYGPLISLQKTLARLASNLGKLAEASEDPLSTVEEQRTKIVKFYMEFYGGRVGNLQRWFYLFSDDTIPAGQALERRRKAYEALHFALSTSGLDPEVKKLLEQFDEATLEFGKKKGFSPEKILEWKEKLTKSRRRLENLFPQYAQWGAFTAMKHIPKVAAFSGNLGTHEVNLDQEFVDKLSRAVMDPSGNQMAAAKALFTYKEAPLHKSAVERLEEQVKEAARKAKTVEDKRDYLNLYTALNTGEDPRD